MKKLSAILYCGHESRYGLAHFGPLLTSEVLDIREVVFATAERWKKFRAALSGEPVHTRLQDGVYFKRRAWKAMQSVRRMNKNCIVRFVPDVNTEDEASKASQYDLVISAAYPQIFNAELIASPEIAAINFHPSYLPRCRGAHPVYWAIASGEDFSGVSCHMMTSRLDAGDIIARRRIEFSRERIIYDELYALVEGATPGLVADAETFFAKGASPVAQGQDRTYFRNDRTIHHKLFFNMLEPREISARIRAGQAFAFDREGRKVVFLPPVEILESSRHLTNNIGHHIANGTVVDAHSNNVDIKVGDSVLKTRYQFFPVTRYEILFNRVKRKLSIKDHKSLEIGEILQ